jgi:hypothetical protein
LKFYIFTFYKATVLENIDRKSLSQKHSLLLSWLLARGKCKERSASRGMPSPFAAFCALFGSSKRAYKMLLIPYEK